MIFKYLAATVALGTVLASTPAPAMPASNLAAVAPPMTDSVRYCRYRGCGRLHVRRYYAPSYYSYGPSYYNSYAYGPGYYGAYGYGGPSISFWFGSGRGFGGHRGGW
jgi:hypothetical protein